MSEGSRRRVTYTQLETLWEFLNEHRGIATGHNKTSRARDTSKRMWQTIAQTLNAQGDGAVKDWKGWNKYWNDYKSKLKKSVATNRASQARTGGGPSEVTPLTEIEEKFLEILGESYGSRLSGARVEPFEQAQVIEIQEGEVEVIPHPIQGGDIFIPFSSAPPSPVTPTRQNASPVLLHTQNQPPTEASLHEPAPPLIIPRSPQPPQTSGTNEQNSQLHSPRRRFRRREPPLSQEAARRRLIAISEQRSQNELAQTEILQQLVQEIRVLNEILRTRLPLLDTPVLDLHDQS